MISPITHYPERPGFKSEGTSQMAASAVAEDAEKQREQCLMLLQERDYTADEIAEMLRKSVLSIRPRVSELHTKGIIFKAEKIEDGKVIYVRRKNASGHAATVWSTRRPGQLL